MSTSRVTRQMIEVLIQGYIPTSHEFISSALTLGQSVSVLRISNISVSNAISLSTQVIGGKIYTQNTGNTIVFSQDVFRVYEASSALSLGQTLSTQLVHRLDLESDLALNQVLHVSAVHTVSLSSTVQTITPTFDPLTLTLVDVVTGLDSSVSTARTDGAPEGFHHALQLQSHVGAVLVKATAIDVAVGNTLSLGQGLFKNQVGSGINTIQLGQILQADYCKVVSSTLELDNSVSAVVVRSLSFTSALSLDHSLTFVVLSVGVLDQYHPFIGAGASGPSLTINGPLSGIVAPFQLVYPAAGPVTASVTLRSPDFGNKDRLSFNRISRETRGGTLIVFADPNWPKIQTLSLNFSALRRYQAQDLLVFLDSYLGQEVGLIDWEHRYWKGIIVSPENPVIQDGKDSFSASFNFEGEMDPTWSPQVIPELLGGPESQQESDFSGSCPAPPVNLVSEPSGEVIYAIADEGMSAGQVVFVSRSGHVALALASIMPDAGAIGVLVANVDLALTAQYINDGPVTLNDWTAITGTTLLTPGAIYWLSTTVDGGLTDTAPDVSGYLVPIGRAVSETQLVVEIQESIKL